MTKTHESHDDPPEYHNRGNENARFQALEQDLRVEGVRAVIEQERKDVSLTHVGERLKKGIGDEEDGESSVVISRGHVQVRYQAIELCIANVGSVEETAEVQEAEPGDECEIKLEKQLLVLVATHEG